LYVTGAEFQDYTTMAAAAFQNDLAKLKRLIFAMNADQVVTVSLNPRVSLARAVVN
jgi:uncharacterized protein YbjQ (UPF0145 family)